MVANCSGFKTQNEYEGGSSLKGQKQRKNYGFKRKWSNFRGRKDHRYTMSKQYEIFNS